MRLSIVVLAIVMFCASALTAPAQQGKPGAGDPAPAVVAETWIKDGKILDTKATNQKLPAQMKNKVVVLDFFVYWSAPCYFTTVHIGKLAEKYKDNKSVMFISLSAAKDDEREAAAKLTGMTLKEKNRSIEARTKITRAWLKKLKVNWLVGLGSKTWIPLKLEHYPVTLVIGKSGNIFWTDEQPGSIEAAIKRALAED